MSAGKHVIGRLTAAALLLAVLLAGCRGASAAVQKEEQAPVAVQKEEQPSVQMVEQEHVKQEVQSISSGNYAYECLNETEQELYDLILNGILTFQEKIELPVVEVEDIERAYHGINCDYGGLFWVNGYTYTIYTQGEAVIGLEFAPSYTMDSEQKQQYQAQIDQVVDEWLQGISIHDSDYDKAKYVFDNLIQRVDYRTDAPENQNILSVFLYGETVCQGYACATQYLMRHLGIPCIVVTGTARNEAHAWNIVLLDGQYYHMDTTWGNSRYLNQDQQENKYIDYNFMCMTDQELERTHKLDMEIDMPACTSMENNYFVHEGCYFDSWVPEEIGQLIYQSREEGRESVMIKCSDNTLYQQMVEYFIKDQHIVDYCPELMQIYYMENPEFCELTINFHQQ